MRHVLIISPHFPPVNAPDHQRVRMSLPYLGEFGWEATVLAVKPECVEGATLDPLLEQTILNENEIIRVGAVSSKLTRYLGLGSLAIRALPYLWKTGSQILSGSNRWKGKKVDLVYFSTTQFPVTILGPIWKRRFGVPYVVDFQDPWLDDYYERKNVPPPGGKFRYHLSRFLARRLEPRVMRHVSQVISVSPAYIETLLQRYGYLRQDQFTTLAFGVPERDFELLSSLRLRQNVFSRDDGKQHWVYVGAAGQIMAPSLKLLFRQLQQLQLANPRHWNHVRLHFFGTSYAPEGGGRKTVEPLAEQAGVGDLVEEQTSRIPYFEALQILRDANALIIPGSDSPGYNPSKLQSYIFARKPMLAILHTSSPAVEILRKCRAAEIVAFDEKGVADMSELGRALKRVYGMAERGAPPDVDEQELKKYTAWEMTKQQSEVFDRAIDKTGT